MKKLLVSLLSLSLAIPVAGIAAPGWHGGPGPGPGFGPYHHPYHYGPHGWVGGFPRPGDRFGFLPGLAATVLVAGLTYYVLDGVYYQRHNNEYVVVNAPPAAPAAPGYASGGYNGNMTVLDLNGERYYVSQGHYYRRDINGQYLEVPRPAGL
ncbi:DUF6515 family protein [Martelella alba]|uniref:Uncharacterized protein n=1 Tax=Martelella alba TaxID=2590451 RepID=A0ABY2SQF0_9HYPH|nr:DUF6515 family protein [Martelella alba]TKI08326.1 hypothetical protein FCN80_04060 [Martelella alba]